MMLVQQSDASHDAFPFLLMIILDSYARQKETKITREFLAHFESGDPSFMAGFHLSFEPVFDQSYFYPVPMIFHDGSGSENPPSNL